MSTRPPVFTWNEELHFGPPSELIDIQTFVNDADNLHFRAWNGWQQLPEDIERSIKRDCDLDDHKVLLAKNFSSQKRMHYLHTAHAEAISQCGIAPPRKRNSGKAKQHTVQNDPDLEEFKNLVEHTPLRIWNLKAAAGPYIRGGHVSDQNALDTPKPRFPELPNNETTRVREVLITLTTYTRNTWYPYAFSRDSQHALLSSNTLEDVWSCIPCPLSGNGKLPKEVTEVHADPNGSQNIRSPKETVVGYETGSSESDTDGVIMVIEGVAYSNDHGHASYADKLLFHLERFKPASDALPPLPLGPYERPISTAPLTKGLPVGSVQLRTLNLRINEPYWILHRGSCEHWFVLDEIRLLNPRDPSSGYPIGLQQTPTFRPLCRICSKVPATLSVLNYIHLGESPCLVCQPCWELFGGSPQAEGRDDLIDPVVVVPIAFETP